MWHQRVAGQIDDAGAQCVLATITQAREGSGFGKKIRGEIEAWRQSRRGLGGIGGADLVVRRNCKPGLPRRKTPAVPGNDRLVQLGQIRYDGRVDGLRRREAYDPFLGDTGKDGAADAVVGVSFAEGAPLAGLAVAYVDAIAANQVLGPELRRCWLRLRWRCS